MGYGVGGRLLPRISVIVPVHNSVNHIEACLRALTNQTVAQGDYEIIVIDDGSSDDTLRAVSHHPVRAFSQFWQGPAAARNRGLSAAQGDLVLFTDADCEPAPDWIEQMCRPFSDPRVSGVKGVYRTRQHSLVARFVQLEYEDKYRRMARYQTIDFIDTYSAGYRSCVLREIAGFDTRFPTASVEDQELSFRLAKAGRRLVFQPTAVVYHRHASTLGAYARKKFRIGYWKVLVHLRHPDKLLHDSHTPQVLKLQLVMVPLGLASWLSSGLWSPLTWVALGTTGLLFLSMAPFITQVCRADPPVALVAPWLLLVRAAALGMGFGVGLAARVGKRVLDRLS